MIPTHNRCALLRQTLESLQGLEVAPNCEVEILVIDNASRDDTPAVIEAAGRRLQFPVKRIEELQLGLNYARNRGIQEARFSLIVYFDDDVLVGPEWINAFIEVVTKYDADCVVGQVFPWFLMLPPQYMSERVIEGISSRYSNKGNNILVLDKSLAHEVPGCNFGVRKEVAVEIGGFRSGLDRTGTKLLAGGDTEFGRRLGQQGKRVVYHPKCWVKHAITAEKMDKNYLRRRWLGSGITRYKLEQLRNRKIYFRRRFRYFLGALKLTASAAVAKVWSSPDIAFERELRAWEAWGYIVGPLVKD